MERKWWHEKVAYQIYPKSFYDTDQDGIGDLRGIIEKLDYLQELGVEIIWISPVYRSPMADQGYDIADYYSIDPRFGTMEDMDELIAEAKKRGIGIIMDLVVNHCSDEHEWFRKACEDPDGEYGKYFYIEDRKDGEYPNNWRSFFGGSAWEMLPGHPDKCYLHLFHRKQPDLNWENPRLREEIYDMICWWLDKGLAGFRIDAIINIQKRLPFHGDPADRPDGTVNASVMLADVTQGLYGRLSELKERTFARYDAFTAAEVFSEERYDLKKFFGDGGFFSTIFDFTPDTFGISDKGWYDRTLITPDGYRDTVFASQKRADEIGGFYSNIIENHDECRGVSRYIPEGDADPVSKKALATVFMSLKGLPFIYQGQEIGMENIRLESMEEVDDISSFYEYTIALDAGLTEEEALKRVNYFTRDNARTPFQWNDGPNAGFTSGKPWMKVNSNYREINLESQRRDPDSVFSHYKKLIALRKDPAYKETVIYGDLRPSEEKRENLIAFTRETEGQTLLVLANFSREAQTVDIKGAIKKVLINNYEELDCEETAVTLKGYQAVILEL